MKRAENYSERFNSMDDSVDIIACDYYSIRTELDEISEANVRMRYMDEDHNGILIAAAELYMELERVVEEFNCTLPARNSMDDCGGSGAYWFNSAACLYNGADMTELAANEGKDLHNAYKEKSVRLRGLYSLAKEQHLTVLTKTFSMLFRYMRIKTELAALQGVDDELLFLHSCKKTSGGIELPDSAWI